MAIATERTQNPGRLAWVDDELEIKADVSPLMLAAGDPDWDESEHPRGPDGKFIEDGSPDIHIESLEKAIAVTSLSKNIAYMKGEDYKAQSLHEELLDLQKQLADLKAAPKTPHSPKHAAPVPKLSPTPKAAGGKPITAWTKTIYSGKYEDGEIVAVKDGGSDASERITWDAEAKKFVWQKENVFGGWTSGVALTKKDAYNKFKDEKKSWMTPAPGATVTTEAPPPPDFDLPAKSISVQDAITQGDFSSLKQVGGQAGSTSGGFFEAPDGSRWYVKSQKSEKHAKNEALAAALYNAAGVEVPAVIRGSGTPGLSGQNHTATRIIEGANPNLKQKLNDPDYLAKIREGFVVDAWLANWDTVGLVFDNIVEDANGSPKRIDVGGSLVFRAMGDEKGSLFGPTVGELETLRNPQMAPSASKVFGGISDDELSVSAAKVAAISPEQIQKLVSDYGMDPKVSDVLIARREDILSKITPAKPKTSPAFTILPASQRGKSGDGHFAPKIWGKYGAAGVMMRHVDDDGIERFLLVKANTANSKRWQLPGGALEELETPEQGAAREVHEELGFTQEFLHNMTPIGTHKVTIDVPEKGQWHYSNIAVDVPSMPSLTWDENELGGAKWMTAKEIDALGAKDEIHPALKANLTKIIAKFPIPEAESKPVLPDPAPAVVAPTISQQSTSPSTTWTKGKFNTTVANKTSYANHEVVGVVDINGDSTRIMWENGKFRAYRYHYGKGWQYHDTWASKKAALADLKDRALYRPPAGTMDINQDFISIDSINDGNSTIITTQDVLQELLDAIPTKPSAPVTVPSSFGSLVVDPFHKDGSPYVGFKTSFKVSNSSEHIGAIHENFDGTWHALAAAGRQPYLTVHDYSNRDDALQALSAADDAYHAAKANENVVKVAAPVASPATKKAPTLTAAQIEKQNGAIPKTLKSAQKTAFFKNLKEKSPVGKVLSNEPDTQKLFKALVFAVQEHNKTQSPKLNYLQGANVFDQGYSSNQKAQIIKWLQTSEGKALAPAIINGGGVAGAGTFVPPDYTPGLTSPYAIGTPQKVSPDKFRTMSNTDMRDLFADMYEKNPLTSAQRNMISSYKSGSDEFNDPLRGNDTLNSYNMGKINTLQSAMRPATESFVVWRGTDGLGFAINKYTIKSLDDLKKFEGAVVGDPAFFSSAFDPNAKFSGRKFTLIVNVPKGTPSTVAWAATPSFDSEKEVVLAAGLHYKIDRVESIGPDGYEHYNLYLTVIPEMQK